MTTNADIERIHQAAVAELMKAPDLSTLNSAMGAVTGKTSELAALKKGLAQATAEQRRELGQALNRVNGELGRLAAERRAEFERAARLEQLAAERLDLTEVPTSRSRGHLHLVSQTMEELEDVFIGLGFEIAEGPEVEDDWHNFTGLNVPLHHPARDMQDTFLVNLGEPGDVVMRTHTSPVQLRVMESQGPPIYVVAPGRVHRNEARDATHLATFHQIEALVVDEGITFGHMAGLIDAFTEAYFGVGFSSRLRPSYFPFTEPSAEFDIRRPDGSWLELGGCGMVHPNVLTNGGIDPERYTGFAFGFGIDRLALARHGVPDLREIHSVDVRFLEQF